MPILPEFTYNAGFDPLCTIKDLTGGGITDISQVFGVANILRVVLITTSIKLEFTEGYLHFFPSPKFTIKLGGRKSKSK